MLAAAGYIRFVLYVAHYWPIVYRYFVRNVYVEVAICGLKLTYLPARAVVVDGLSFAYVVGAAFNDGVCCAVCAFVPMGYCYDDVFRCDSDFCLFEDSVYGVAFGAICRCWQVVDKWAL